MTKALLGVVCALALTSCRLRGPSWEHVGGNVMVVSCRGAAQCYRGASDACAYGYDRIDSTHTTGVVAHSQKVGNSVQTTFVPTRRDELVVKCREPAFCEQQACADGLRCVTSQRFPGRAVCAMR